MSDPNLEALNAKQPKDGEYCWSTYIPTRSTTSNLKVHRLKAHAKSALKNTYPWNRPWWEAGCKVYEKVDGRWVDRSADWQANAEEDHRQELVKQAEKERLRKLCPSPCAHCTVRVRS